MNIANPSIPLKLSFTLSLVVLLAALLPPAAALGSDGDHPALIPAPRSVEWGDDSFSLGKTIRLVCPREGGMEFLQTAAPLATILKECGAAHVVVTSGDPQNPGTGNIGVGFGELEPAIDNREAYRLDVTAERVRLFAPTATGLFRGAQTLRQLVKKNEGAPLLAGCSISDWPAFAMRGIMFDVGRNFISIGLMKEWIDTMVRYKMNLFHFHPTEHIGWRLQIKSHPELTAAEHQIRNKGKFYTQKEIREFVAWCKQRHVMVIPEIDMPGHSDAFVRATGHRMESPEGMAILEDVLREVCALFEAPFVHLGSDEVKIRNPDFIPAMAKVVRDLGKEVVLWRPGGPLDKRAVYQLWHNGKHSPGDRVIDSRDLYMNHLDWFSGVRFMFHKQICDADQGTENLLGGITCLWPDRRVERETDQFRMSPVGPLMLTFAERTWRGSGFPELERSMAEPGSAAFSAFVDFEKRLVARRDADFAAKPFAYVRQADMVWRVFGPFPNEGELDRAFRPEEESRDWYEQDGRNYAPIETRGGTLLFGGWYDQGIFGPTRNATAYAETWVKAETEIDAHMWIGFRSWSRSHRDATPGEGEWDHRQGKIWLNGKPIPPPAWAKPGRKGDAEDPLIDEGYAYRPPTPVHLDKGWNRILVKAPVGKDKVKWMCTAALVSWDGRMARELEGVTWASRPEGEEISRNPQK